MEWPVQQDAERKGGEAHGQSETRRAAEQEKMDVNLNLNMEHMDPHPELCAPLQPQQIDKLQTRSVCWRIAFIIL